jgi:hypothetical protein
VERAFELARSGDFKDLEQLKKQLNREGFSQEHIYGRLLYQQLRKLIAEAAVVAFCCLPASRSFAQALKDSSRPDQARSTLARH